MIHVAVVEDEKEYIEQITSYLRRFEEEEKEEIKITVYQDGDDITAEYRAQFDIILMDIQMKFVDGMTAAEEIRKMDSEVIIIFITNRTQYAIRGYEVDALDYVLKPVSYFAFSQKLKKAVARIKKKESRAVVLQIRGGMVRIDTDDIYFIESEGHTLIYHTVSGEYKISGSIKSIEEKYAEFGFSRGNSCYLINLSHVDKIEDKCAVVKGKRLQLSRLRFSGFVKALAGYWGNEK